MKTLKPLSLSFLAAWITSALGLLLGYLMFSSPNHVAAEFPGIAAMYAFYSGAVVLAAWVLVATPYFFLCIRNHRFRSRILHLAAAVGSAIAAAGLLTGFDGDAWLMLGLIASASAITGTLTLLHLNPSNTIES